MKVKITVSIEVESPVHGLNIASDNVFFTDYMPEIAMHAGKGMVEKVSAMMAARLRGGQPFQPYKV